MWLTTFLFLLPASASDVMCEADACTALGKAYFDGAGVPQDRFRAVQLYRKGCDEGDAHACMFLAEAYRRGEALRPDPAKSGELYMRACELGDGLACRSVGDLYTMGSLGGADGKTAGVWYSLGCDLGDAQSCTAAGLWFERGDLGQADPAKALMLFQRGCEGGHARGCTMLGDRHLRGSDGAKRDPILAYTWYEKGCKKGFDPESCRALGIAQIKGKPIAPARDAGLENLDRACYANDPVACRHVALELKGDKQAEALVAAERGCELGDDPSCRQATRIRWRMDLAAGR